MRHKECEAHETFLTATFMVVYLVFTGIVLPRIHSGRFQLYCCCGEIYAFDLPICSFVPYTLWTNEKSTVLSLGIVLPRIYP